MYTTGQQRVKKKKKWREVSMDWVKENDNKYVGREAWGN